MFYKTLEVWKEIFRILPKKMTFFAKIASELKFFPNFHQKFSNFLPCKSICWMSWWDFSVDIQCWSSNDKTSCDFHLWIVFVTICDVCDVIYLCTFLSKYFCSAYLIQFLIEKVSKFVENWFSISSNGSFIVMLYSAIIVPKIEFIIVKMAACAHSMMMEGGLIWRAREKKSSITLKYRFT